MSKHARQKPRGVSLVEMLAVTSASTVVIGAAIVVLATIGRADRVYDKRLNQQHAVAQLAGRLRVDIYAAEQVTWDQSKGALGLTATDGGVVSYHAEEGRWVRRTLASGREGEGELSGAYVLPAGLLAKIEPAEAPPGERLRIEWTLPAAEGASRGAPSTTVELIAIVGRDERLLHE